MTDAPEPEPEPEPEPITSMNFYLDASEAPNEETALQFWIDSGSRPPTLQPWEEKITHTMKKVGFFKMK